MKLKYSQLLLVSLLVATHVLATDLDLKPLANWPGPIRNLAWGSSGVAVSGQLAYVTGTHRGGLYILDLSDTVEPRLVGSLETSGVANAVALAGHYALVLESGRILVVDVNDPSHPQRVGVFKPRGNAQALAISGSRAYVAYSLSSAGPLGFAQGSVQIVDISDPTRIRALGEYQLENISARYVTLSALSADGDTLCVRRGDSGFLEVVDVHDPAVPRLVGTYEPSGEAKAVIVSGNRAYVRTEAYVTSWRVSIEVIDLVDPTNPNRVGLYDTPGRGGNLSLSGHYLYSAKNSVSGDGGAVDILDVADSTKPVRVGGFSSTTAYAPLVAVVDGMACLRTDQEVIGFDVSDPKVMRRLGTLSAVQGTADVAVSGNTAFVAHGTGLVTLDISNPASPRQIGFYKTTSYARRVACYSNYVYLVDGNLTTLDVSDPAIPRRTSSSFAAASSGRELAVSGQRLYLVGFGTGLHVYDLTNPAIPRRVGGKSVRYPDSDMSVAASENYVYVIEVVDFSSSTGYSSLVEIFDVSNPSSPQLVGTYDIAGRADSIAVAGKRAVVAGFWAAPDRSEQGGFAEILDLTSPSFPVQVAYHGLDSWWYGAYAVAIIGDRAFIGGRSGEFLAGFESTALEILDLSGPGKPARIGGFNNIGSRVAISGDCLLSADNTTGLNVTQMETTTLNRINTVEVVGKTVGVAVAGNTALVAAGKGGLQILDVGGPEQPTTIGQYETGGMAENITIVGNRGYAAAGEVGLIALDLSTSSTPQALGTIDTSGDSRAVLLSGSIAYVADGREGVQVIDVSNPALPTRIGGYPTTGLAMGMALHGNHLLVACREGGLVMLDISEPSAPRYITGYNRGGYTAAVAVSGDYAVVADQLDGFGVFDLTNPTTLKRVGEAPAFGNARGITVSGRFAYVADARAGVQVYDLADPTRPRRAGGNTSLDPYRLMVSGGKVFVAGGDRGLGSFALFTPTLDVTAAPSMNPGDISLHVDGPSGSSVRVQRSSDLINWQDWQTLTLTDLPVTVTDTSAVSATRGFYRAVSP